MPLACALAITAIQPKRPQGQPSIPPSSCYFSAASMHQRLHGDYEMKMSVTKMALATSVALAALVAAEAAYARPPRHQTAPEAYDTEGNPRYGFGPRVTVQPNDVVSGHSVIGRDPDPSI